MGEELKFQQRWEFRRKEDNFDSSSDNSKSCSSSEPVLKKHKLVSSLTAPENGETSENAGLHQSSEYNPGTRDQIKLGKAKKAPVARRKRGPQKKTNGRKGKTSAYEPGVVNDVNVFMEALLRDLKVARENLLTWMKEEIHKLVADDSAQQITRREGSNGKENVQVQHQNNFEENIKAQHQKSFENIQVKHHKKCEENIQIQRQNNLDENVQVQHQNNCRTRRKARNFHGRRSVNKKATDSNNFHQVLEERVDHGAGIGPVTLIEKEKGEKVASSSKLNFQSSLSNQHFQMQLQNNYESGLRGQNRNGGPTERPAKGKKTADSNNCHQSLETGVGYGKGTGSVTSTEKEKGEKVGMQLEQRTGRFTDMGLKNMSYFDQNSYPNSSIGSGIPDALHHSTDGRFNIPSQVNYENQPREYNHTVGLRMNGGAIRFSGESNTLSEYYGVNNFHSHLNFRPDGGFGAVQTPDLSERAIYPQSSFNRMNTEQ